MSPQGLFRRCRVCRASVETTPQSIDEGRANVSTMDHGWQAGPISANPGYVPGICRHPQNFEGSFRELRGNLKLAV